jgi:hypothetical protein
MSTSRSRVLVLSCVAVAVILAGCGDDDRAQQPPPPPPPQGDTVVVEEAPPPPQEEVIEESPGPEYVWIRGEYHWHPRRHEWVWVRGHWARRPYSDSVWVEGVYVREGGGYRYHPGYWRR